ncbi:MAG: family 10 glycosylhydrolase [Gemmatimonadota bacterium]|nr:family 10 glycosylhydrolase [Gemmatimonadota bacterium]
MSRIWVGDTLRVEVIATNPDGVRVSTPTGIVWSTSEHSVATVDGGLITGVGLGNALIVASRSVDSWADTVRIAAVPAEEARALWVNRFEYGANLGSGAGSARIATIMENAARAGFNLIYFQVRGQGDAYYRSNLEPCAVSLCGSLGNGHPSWDPLEIAIGEAHRRGLQIHAWVNAFSAWASPSSNTASYCALLQSSRDGFPDHMLLDHPEWAVVSADGTISTCANSQAYEYAYVSPGIPGVRAHLARVAADLARRYAVDGVHLDRIRYPGSLLSYDAPSIQGFGRTAPSTDPDWIQWRRDAVSLAVREVRDSLASVRGAVVLSAAVWPIYQDRWGWNSSQGYSQYFQDPGAWATAGVLDVAVPMTYPPTQSSSNFNITQAYCAYTDWACLLDDHIARIQNGAGRHLYIGIGANRGRAEVERQLLYARSKGAKGVSIYALTAVERDNLWDALGNGVFRIPARVPTMPRK